VRDPKRKANHSGQNEMRRPHRRSVEELTRRNVETISRLEQAASAKRDRFDRMAEGITRFCGSMRFVIFHAIWYFVWILLNVATPHAWRWDPFPFPFLTLIVSLEAIFLSTFILVAQNRQAVLNERRAQLDLQVNLLSEQENTKMLELLRKIGEKVGVDLSNDREEEAFEEVTRPQKLLQQIDKMAKSTNS
jgi:uncharacterized membrane protein